MASKLAISKSDKASSHLSALGQAELNVAAECQEKLLVKLISGQRYMTLQSLLQAGKLTENEQAELISLSDRIENENALRIEYLAEMAVRQGTTVEILIQNRSKPTHHE